MSVSDFLKNISDTCENFIDENFSFLSGETGQAEKTAVVVGEQHAKDENPKTADMQSLGDKQDDKYDKDTMPLFLHKDDKAAMEALNAIPGFTLAFKEFIKIWDERQFRITNLSSCIRLGEDQLPEYYHMLQDICRRMKIDVPELYLQLDSDVNAYTYGDTNPFIVINSELLKAVPKELVPAIIAHECGHIVCHHTLYTTMTNAFLRGMYFAGNFSSLASLVTFPMKVALCYWSRCSEFSADRAAAVYGRGSDAMTDVCMCLAGWDKEIGAKPNKEAFMRQASEYQELVKNSKWDKVLEFYALLGMDHPFTAVRAYEIDQWCKTEEFQKALAQYQEA